MYVIKVKGNPLKKGIDTMAKKLTKIEMFAQIKTRLTNPEEIAFVEHEIELLENKKSSVRKPTANQVANENFMNVIVEVLEQTNKPMTISEIQEHNESLALLTNQRVSALLTKLISSGTVVRTTTFGAFVDIGGGKEGLVHISKISKERVKNVEDYVKIGDKVPVKVIEIDDQGRINLTMKDLVEAKEDNEENINNDIISEDE